MRVLFFGMLGQFSSIPFQALLSSDVQVCAVVVPAATGFEPADSILPLSPRTGLSLQLPLVAPSAKPDIVQLAWEQGIPAFQLVKAAGAQTLATIRSFEPDVAFVACFSKIIPKDLLEIPTFGFYNVHPSLLPSFRGPEPLFWTFRHGIQETGVTIHVVDEGVDTGDIAIQARLLLPDGITGIEAERQCAKLGGELILATVDRLRANTLRLTPQGPGRYYPSPTAQDFQFPSTWPARRAFNFMRGTAEWGYAYQILTRKGTISLGTALTFSSSATLPEPFVTIGERVQVQLKPGVIEALRW